MNNSLTGIALQFEIEPETNQYLNLQFGDKVEVTLKLLITLNEEGALIECPKRKAVAAKPDSHKHNRIISFVVTGVDSAVRQLRNFRGK